MTLRLHKICIYFAIGTILRITVDAVVVIKKVPSHTFSTLNTNTVSRSTTLHAVVDQFSTVTAAVVLQQVTISNATGTSDGVVLNSLSTGHAIRYSCGTVHADVVASEIVQLTFSATKSVVDVGLGTGGTVSYSLGTQLAKAF